MARCEDYPCCGHTDGLGCDWVAPTEYPHAGCDHNAGYCDVWEAEQDDDSESEDDPPAHLCEVCRSSLHAVGGKWEHEYPQFNTWPEPHKPVYLTDYAEDDDSE